MTSPTAKADRIGINRAPRGGAISPVNGMFYRGGQFMPMAVPGLAAGPARVEGSGRQVAWATRLKREELARLDRSLVEVNELLADSPREEKQAVRAIARKLAIARHLVSRERSAAAIIEGRVWARA